MTLIFFFDIILIKLFFLYGQHDFYAENAKSFFFFLLLLDRMI